MFPPLPLSAIRPMTVQESLPGTLLALPQQALLAVAIKCGASSGAWLLTLSGDESYCLRDADLWHDPSIRIPGLDVSTREYRITLGPPVDHAARHADRPGVIRVGSVGLELRCFVPSTRTGFGGYLWLALPEFQLPDDHSPPYIPAVNVSFDSWRLFVTVESQLHEIACGPGAIAP